MLTDRDLKQISRSLAYENKISVARVATGFFFPMRFENLVEYELMMIIRSTRNITGRKSQL